MRSIVDVAMFLFVVIFTQLLHKTSAVCPCEAGFFTTGNGTCTICPAGSACINGSSTQATNCQDGYYSRSGAVSCTPCAAGTYQITPSGHLDGTCLPCTAGSYCSAPAAAKVSCLAGSYSAQGSTFCTLCASGTFNTVLNSDSCAPCPAGKACPLGSSAPLNCSKGYFSDSGASTCTPCADNTYSNVTAATSCTPCLTGFTSYSGAASCFLCPLGFSCSSSGATPCQSAGKYALNGVCLDCPIGYKCLGISPFLPIACTTGSYASTQGLAACTPCPAGSFCGDPTVSPVSCYAGSYSAANAGVCIPCPQGSICPMGAQVPSACLGGNYAGPSASSCSICGPGFYSANNASFCVPCSPGSFSSISGATSCNLCTPGSYCPQQATVESVCTPGTYSLNAASNCTLCPAGHSCATITSSPVSCPAGSFSIAGSTSCSPCSRGEFGSSEAAAACLVCPSGSYSTSLNSLSCISCPAGSKCPSTTLDPVLCDPGSYSISSQTSCSSCPAGYSCNNGLLFACSMGQYSASGVCQPCPLGFYCPNPIFNLPSPCPSGSYASVVNSVSCSPCPAGSSCLNANSNPITCTSGYYSGKESTICTVCANGLESTSGSSTCFPCAAGFACASGAVKVACNSGFYSPSGSASCLPCGLGAYSFENASVCYVCPSGSECLSGVQAVCIAGSYSPGGDSRCITCPIGFYCPNTGNPVPIACAPATYSLSTGAAACSPCPTGSFCTASTVVPCNAGYYTPNTLLGDTTCFPCPAGYSCSGNTNATCAAGLYSNVGSGVCANCPQGFSCVSPSLPPVSCLTGEYRVSPGLACVSCPAGSECPALDQSPSPCPPGKYSLGKEMACTSCPAGFSCSNSAVSPVTCLQGTYSIANSITCIDCPAGSACRSTFDVLQVTICVAGTFSLANSARCTPCPAGGACSSTSLVGGSFVACASGYFSTGLQAMCTQCPAGWMCPDLNGAGNAMCTFGSYAVAGQLACTLCPAGKACPDTRSSATVTSCPSGSYSLIGQGICTVCPAGSYCPSITTATIISCVAGQYSVQGQSSCTRCPDGFACPLLDSSSVVACPQGYYALNPSDTIGQQSCTQCEAGYACPASVTRTQCTIGTYSLGGASICSACPAGSKCASAGQIAPSLCPEGTYSEPNKDACTPCTAGYICEPGSTTTSPRGGECPVGYYCEAGSTHALKIACPVNKYQPMLSRYLASHCLDCPAGYNCYLTGIGGLGVEILDPIYLCPAGKYCSGIAAATSCLAGTYNSALGATSVSACIICPAGTHCPLASKEPLICGLGKYCLQNAATETSCPAGTFLDRAGATNLGACTNNPCPPGHYCPLSSATPTPCPNGTYNILSAQSLLSHCLPCVSGFACPVTAQAVLPTVKCSQGCFCSSGSSAACNTVCPAGTYTDYTNASSSTDCLPCPAQFACYNGTGGLTLEPVPCAVGSYCPVGTKYPAEHPCPAGTYTNLTNLVASNECSPCERGYYCLAGASTWLGPILSGPCAAGSYCPPSTPSSSAYKCPAGTYRATAGAARIEDCVPCPAGRYCEVGTSVPISCQNGYYNPFTGGTFIGSCIICPAGYRCRNHDGNSGVVTPLTCGLGFYSPPGAPYSSQESLCYVCEVGHFCNQVNTSDDMMRIHKRCPAGTYCGAQRTTPPNLVADACKAGHYCLAGAGSDQIISQYPSACQPGTYSPSTGRKSSDDCLQCPAGSYCGIDPTDGCRCTTGYDCLITTSPYGAPAIVLGPYNYNVWSLTTGKWPHTTASWIWNNINVATLPAVSDTITFSTIINVSSTKAVRIYMICDNIGSFHVNGRFAKNIEFEGWRAEYNVTVYDFNLTTGSNLLTLQGANFFNGGPNPAGIIAAVYDISAGTEISERILLKKTDSTWFVTPSIPPQCTPGNGLSEPTGLCHPGFYCPTGSSLGSNPLTGCLPGLYVSTGGSESDQACGKCPPGYYCPTIGTSVPIVCPPGSYCTVGTAVPSPCPSGTFRNSTMAFRSSQCAPCTAGQFCASPGLSAPSGLCKAGYYCKGNAITDAPTNSNTGDLCPAGGYCVAGATTPASCPEGSFSAAIGANSSSVCTPCTPGSFCVGSTSVEPTDLCFPGYYCTGGAKLGTQFQSSPGYFSGRGASTQSPCPIGTFQNAHGQASCVACDKTKACLQTNMTNPADCPTGKYCPGAGQVLNCPSGTFSDETQRESLSQCKSCSSGSYCGIPGLSAVSGPCTAGYYCAGNASDPTSNNSECPKGHYCPSGAVSPVPCLQGTYRNITAGKNASDCVSCLAGSYCETTGLTVPTALCAAKYYCLSGVKTATPLGLVDAGDGDLCPVGFFCPIGTAFPRPCNGGGYTDIPGNEVCKVCEAGYFCNLTTLFRGIAGVRGPPEECTEGNYCEAGTGAILKQCPTGTYSTQKKNENASSCTNCIGGNFCALKGQTASFTSGVCSAGYYCNQGVNIATPNGINNSGIGGPCTTGHYCAQATTNPAPCPVGTYNPSIGSSTIASCLPCTPGMYCASMGLGAPTAYCDGGYYCPGNNVVKDPISTRCPIGSYCAIGVAAPSYCPAGTYGNVQGLSLCLPCASGYYCPLNSSGSFNRCSPGYYCPLGTPANNSFPCPPGTYNSFDLADSITYCLNCDAGKYCQGYGLSSVTGSCNPGWYCSLGASQPQPAATNLSLTCNTSTGGSCLAGFYCPLGSSAPQPCPAGKYCLTNALSISTGNCSAGYYCLGRASTNVPQDGVTGNICNKGYYCPAGTYLPIPCPVGTFSNSVGMGSLANCGACTAGFYCGIAALTNVSGACQSGYYCPAGQTQQDPALFTCPVGYKCPAGAADKVLCAAGEYQDQTLQSSCKPCLAGYLCNALGMSISTTFPCPVGHYCPSGTKTATEFPCLPGTFNPNTGQVSSSACLPCTVGKYCNTNGLSAVSGDCSAGYFCLASSTTATPAGAQCTPGAYCPTGSGSPTPCPIGTYSVSGGNTMKLVSDCTNCTGGKYCAASNLTAVSGVCSAGYYCSARSSTPTPTDGVMGNICPAGSYCPTNTVSPIPCPSGKYSSAQFVVCLDSPSGNYVTDGINILICPIGNYCPNATGATPLPCPTGTFGNVTGLHASAHCQQCTAGRYCGSAGLTGITNVCSGGFYCQSGVDVATPNGINNKGVGGPCPAGRYCPQGTVTPILCSPGTYNSAIGSSDSSACLACMPGYYCATHGLATYTGKCILGYYCTGGAIVDSPTPCPIGTACPEQSVQPQACASGYYSDRTGQGSCTICPAGHFCLVNSTGYLDTICPTGSYCPIGTKSATEHLCPIGTMNNFTLRQEISDCLPCLAGYYCATSGLSIPSGGCAAGWYCSRGASTSQPSNGAQGGICPVGSYCPSNSAVAIPCSLGKFCATNNLAAPSGNCTAGIVCPLGSSVASPVGSQSCSVGFYCPAGSTTTTQSLCPIGFECPAGSASPLACSIGRYQSQEGQGTCNPCSAGFACAGAVLLPCQAGYYCPQGSGSVTEFPCPTGTYNPSSQSSSLAACLPCMGGKVCSATGLTFPNLNCSAGYYCSGNASSSTPALGSTGGPCEAGSYCPAGSALSSPCPEGTISTGGSIKQTISDCNSCPAGSYCANTGSTVITGACTAGFYCTSGATSGQPTDNVTGNICPVGYECPVGSVAPVRCNDGFYSNQTRAAACQPCLAGSYCPSRIYLEPCPLGHYCPSQTGLAAPSCPSGTFSIVTGLQTMSDCQQCPSGYYCESTGLSVAPTTKCAAGFYCQIGVDVAMPNGISNKGTGYPCPTGRYCPAGTTTPILCDAGTFNNFTGRFASQHCLQCNQGHYCDAAGLPLPTGLCRAGYYCSGNAISDTGMTVSVPTDLSCPVGTFCVTGSVRATPCPKGTYQPNVGQSQCTSCPAGYSCSTDGISDYSNLPCLKGYYCPEGSQSNVACPIGTFRREQFGRNLADCQDCTEGYYCASTGSDDKTGECAAGWYCTGKSSSATPTTGPTGGICPPGAYCLQNSVAPTPCPVARFCNTTGIKTAGGTGPCADGYSCVSGAESATPTDGVTGALCFKGHYCPSGVAMQSCPAGTFNLLDGQHSRAACLNCTAGYYCSDEGLVNVSGVCNAGYYCPPGQASPDLDTFICPAGSYCTIGSMLPEPCPAGMYQSSVGQARCLDCPVNKFCARGTANPVDCIAGFACPANTSSSSQFPCPIGTYSDQPSLSSTAQCVPCDAGYYCSTEGLSASTTRCQAGFVCYGGATFSTPTDGTRGIECPAGSYCPEGSSFSIPCPTGTFNPFPRQFQLDHCTPCTAGSYCDMAGLSSVAGSCAAGFYCLAGAQKATPQSDPLDATDHGGQCPVGYYCPSGTGINFLNHSCAAGTYSASTGLSSQAECQQCDAGFYCVGAAAKEICPERYFCPTSTASASKNICTVGATCPAGSLTPLPCSIGMFSNVAGSLECIPCPAGSWCNSTGVVVPVGCPVGYACERGTEAPEPCPPGTYSNAGSLTAIFQCLQCPSGKYCDGVLKSAPSGPCAANYFCPEGSISDALVDHLCTLGHYCPTGTAVPIPCPIGTYADQIGRDSCQPCLPGYLCASTGIIVLSVLCPPGSYCPSNSGVPTLCPPGSFRNTPGAMTIDECVECTIGSYCGTAGLILPTGPCSAGYYCSGCASSSQPPAFVVHASLDCTSCFCDPEYVTGNICPSGYYCPEGSTTPVLCTAGSYCGNTQLTAIQGLCDPGYFCVSGSTVRNPPSGACPTQKYCPAGSATPRSCPPGKYANTTGLSQCTSCSAGFICPSEGLLIPVDLCPEGYFCPDGQITATEPTAHLCNPGFYCPVGSITEVPCANGTYQSALTQGACLPCPAGRMCSSLSIVSLRSPEFCTAGAYCPLGTSSPILCPLGTYSSLVGNAAVASCMPCPAGKYCAAPGLTAPTGFCAAGYFCINSATATQNICPVGSYCPENSVTPKACNAGFFSTSTGLVNASQCLPCLPGKYCASLGAADSSGALDCDGGYICTGGSSTPRPNSEGGYICPQGSHCPAGVISPAICPIDTYSPQKGLEVCSPCAPRFHCPTPNTTVLVICPFGSYCPGGAPVLCPNGTFGFKNGIRSASECKPCPKGDYCGTGGLLAVTGPCAAGYFCNGGDTTNTPSDKKCPAGYYCPERTTAPIACPLGTMLSTPGAAAITDCLPCTGGHYCASIGRTTFSGACHPSFYCPANLSSSNPEPVGFECIAGHYCPSGTVEPIPCSPGTYQLLEMQEICLDCPPGFYCLGGPSAIVVCPKNSYCPQRSSIPVICPDGTFSEIEGISQQAGTESACQPCVTGMYCRAGRILNNCSAGFMCTSHNGVPTPPLNSSANSTIYNGPCPLGNYCPLGTLLPIPCPAQSYRDTLGAAQISDCLACPAGSFCPSGSADVGPCPQGYYCELATDKVRCPSGTFGQSQGLKAAANCTVCPAGRFCQISLNVPCPYDSYCPYGGNGVVPCPAGTFRNITSGKSVNDCFACTPGFFCPQIILVTQPPCNDSETMMAGPYGSAAASVVECRNASVLQPCPAGYYCPQGSAAKFICPGGYYCPPMAPARIDCPSGNYCPEGASIFTACAQGYFCGIRSSVPSTCPTGFSCPAGSAEPIACIRGFYCNADNSNPIPCPGGYYCAPQFLTYQPCRAGTFCPPMSYEENPCPSGSYCPALSAEPINCSLPYYCPPSSVTAYLCPLGFIGLNGSLDLGSVATACVACPAGSLGTDTLRLRCKVCPKGYYCPSASGVLDTSFASGSTVGYTCNRFGNNYVSTDLLADGSLPLTSFACSCPAGYYCPLSSDKPSACVAGTYSTGTKENDISTCKSCPEDAYSSFEGSTTCKPCGSSSYSPNSSAVCTCQGKNRAFSVTDGQCICLSGYIYFDKVDSQVIEKDDIKDCIPLTSPRCLTGEFLFANRKCVNPSDRTAVESMCSQQCLSAGNVKGLDSSLGICVCYNYTVVEEFCDATCLADLNTQEIQCGEHGAFVVVNRSNPLQAPTTIQCPNLNLGSCSAGSKAHTMSFSKDKVLGVLPTVAFFNEMCGSNVNGSRRRDAFAVDGILNPLVCLKHGETLTFSLSDKAHYPSYDVLNTLNSVNDFDYGAFRQLEVALSSTSLTVPVFSFDFNDPLYFNDGGIFVFYDHGAGDVSSRFYVIVPARGVDCVTSSLQPSSLASLNLFGVSQSTTYLAPDWFVISGALGAAGLVILFLLVVVFIWQPSKWGLRQAATVKFEGMAPTGTDAETNAKKKILLEDFNARKLFSELQAQEDKVADMLSAQAWAIRELHEKMLGQTDALRLLVEKLDLSSIADKHGSGGGEATIQEIELLSSIQQLLSRVKEGATTVALVSVPAQVLLEGPSEEVMNRENLVRILAAEAITKESTVLENIATKLVNEHGKHIQSEVISVLSSNVASDLRSTLDIITHKMDTEMDKNEAMRSLDSRKSIKLMLTDRLKAINDMQGIDDSTRELLKVGLEEDIRCHEAKEIQLAADQQMKASADRVDLDIVQADAGRAAMLQNLISSLGPNCDMHHIKDLSAMQDERIKMQKETLRLKSSERKAKRLQKFDLKDSLEGAEELADFEKTEVFLNMGSDQKIIARVQMRDKIARRQRNDRDAMTSQLDAEEQILLAAVMEKEIELQKTEMKHAASEMIKRSTNGVNSQFTAKELMDSFAAANAAEEARQEAEREQSGKDLQTRLNLIRARKQKEQQRKMADDNAAILTTSMTANQESNENLLIPVVEVTGSNLREQETMVRNQERIEAALKERHDQEIVDLSAKSEREIAEEQRLALEGFENRKMQILREKQQRMAADLEGRSGISNDEMKRIMAEQEKEMDVLRSKLDAEKDRSQDAVKDRLNTRKRAKEDQLRQRQAAESGREQLDQRKELADLVSEQMQEAEHTAIITGMQQNKNGRADEVVMLIFNQRHAREQEDLGRELLAERTIAVSDALDTLMTKQSSQRDRLEALHSEELAELLVSASSVRVDVVEDLRLQMLNRHQIESREQFDAMKEDSMRSEQDTLEGLDNKYSMLRLQLTERQYQEVSVALASFGPSTSSSQAQKLAADELQRVRVSLEEQRLAEEEQIKLDLEIAEKAESERIEKELQDIEDQLQKNNKESDNATESELAIIRARKAELAIERAKIIADSKRSKLVPGNEDKDKDAILKQHDLDQQRLHNKEDSEQKKVGDSVAQRLKKRKEDRSRNVVAAGPDGTATRRPSAAMLAIGKMADDVTSKLNQNTSRANVIVQASRRVPKIEAAAIIEVPEVPINEEEILKTLGFSPLLSKLNQIQNSLSGQVDLNSSYVDIRDRRWKREGTDAIPMTMEQLGGRQFIIYRFGLFLQDMLIRRRQHGRVSVLIARTLPVAPAYVGNAFCNSVHFDAGSNTLLIRAERLDSVGEYMLVLAHSLAHIRVGSMHSDVDPEFLSEFHMCLQVVCEDVYSQRGPIKPDVLYQQLTAEKNSSARDAVFVQNFKL